MEAELSQKASLSMMLGIMKTCFNDCVQDFRVSELHVSDKNCIQNCSKRLAGTYEIIAEVQQSMEQRGGQFWNAIYT